MIRSRGADRRTCAGRSHTSSEFFGAARNLYAPQSPRPSKGQEQLLFHELMHELGEHEVDYRMGTGDKRPGEIDPTEACASVCFGDRQQVTKCECAMCLRTGVCDERCKDFAPCQQAPG